MANKKTATRRRRQPLSRARVLQAALALADESGIETLSMRKLGQSLGVEAMSLYKHVANKEDLLDGLVDLVAEQFEAPSIGGDWKQALRKRARAAHATLQRHPWATSLLLSRVNVGPAMLRYHDATIGCLREAGFSWAATDHAWNAIDNHVYGFTLQEQSMPIEPDQYAEAAKAYLPLIPAERYPYLRGMTDEIIARRHDGINDFDFGLELILDGLERMLRPS